LRQLNFFIGHIRMQKYSPPTFLSKALIVVLMQCAPLAALSQSEDTLDTSTLLAQASDPAVTSATSGSTQTAAPADGAFATDQLEQLVAPIALYSDGLLMQILMASTYPLEIVEANRWVSSNSELTGDALDEALKEEDWDPSVKSLVTFPTVLTEMSDNLDWTQDLGDAFLGQESEVMDTIQIMRGKAYDEGNLETTEQQVVKQDADKIIVIESPSPEIVYVPTYSPTVVYGPGWGYPSYYYPAWYYPPRPGYGLVSFGVGVAVGAAIWGSPGWGWGRGSVNINVHNHNNFNRNTNINAGNNVNIGSGNTKWNHDSSHRKGVNYKNSDVAGKYGANKGSNRVTRDQARGHSTNRATNRGTGTQARDRSAATPRNNSGASAANRSRDTNNARSNNARSPSTNNRSRGSSSSALSGSRSPSVDRRSSSRGASSRGSHSFGGSRGGANRGGGRRH
jgi:hypothetical protein